MNQSTENQQNTETKTTDFSRKFNLKFGYKDKENPEFFHREVTINRRPKGADILKALENGTDFNGADSQINLALIASAISKFGDFTMPVPMTVLLSLNEIDEDKLSDEYLLFLLGTQPEEKQEILKDKRAQLAFGIEREGVKYHVVEFGNLLSGYDRMKIHGETESQWHFTALKMAREVVKISTLDGEKSVSGELTLAELEAMDATDFLLLREAESQWLDSFRD